MHKSINIICLLSICCCQISPNFDGEKAYGYLLKQCDFGARYPGSKEHVELKNYLVDCLADKGDTIIIDHHEINHPYKDDDLALYNIIVRYNMEIEDRIMLMAH